MTVLLPISDGDPLAPRRSPDSPPASGRSEPDQAESCAVKVLRVLVVDDNLVNQQLAALTLELEGYQVEVAHDGRQAVEAVAGGDFDVVLMDIQMPVMSGVEAVQAIRALPAPQRNVWIIAVSGCGISHSMEACRVLAFDGAIPKPYHPDVLLETLAWIDEQRPRHGLTV